MRCGLKTPVRVSKEESRREAVWRVCEDEVGDFGGADLLAKKKARSSRH